MNARWMALKMCSKSIVALALPLWLAGLALAGVPASSLLSASLVTPSSAWTYYGTGTTHTDGFAAWTNSPPEITELAKSLGGNGRLSASQFVQNVYDYVHNNIEVEFRFGLGKGGRGAVIDQSGTPFDQAELMVKVLRQGGLSAIYKVGTMTLNAQQFGLWTGLVTNLDQNSQTFTVDASQACQLLADGGIPATVNGQSDCAQVSGTLSSVTLIHIWVQANGTTYNPSFKAHTLRNAIDISSAMGCGTDSSPSCGSTLTTAAMNGVTSGADSTGPYLQHVNQPALETQLKAFAVNLQTYIQTHDRTAALQDVVGGTARIVSETSSPTLSEQYQWIGDIPNQYRTTLRARVGDNNAGTNMHQGGPTDQTFYADEIAGRLVQVISGPTWVIDGQTRGASGCSSCVDATVILDINHPYATSAGAYGDEHAELGMPGYTGSNGYTMQGTYPVTIVLGLGAGSQYTEQHFSELQTHSIVSFTGQTWDQTNVYYKTYDNDQQGILLGKLLSQGAQTDVVVGGLGKAHITRHHDMGIISARPDDPGSVSYVSVQSAFSIDTYSNDTSLRNAVFEADAAAWSIIEGASTARAESKGLGLSAVTQCGYEALGVEIYHQVTNYASSGYDAVTCSGQGGIVLYKTNSLGYDYGAEGTLTKGGGELLPDPLHSALDTVKQNEKATDKQKYLSVSPTNGAATVTVTDLVTGTGKFPESLPFQRTYRSDVTITDRLDTSNSQVVVPNPPDPNPVQGVSWRYSGPDSASNSHIGGGWTHNYDITASYSGNIFKGFGSDSALDASASIATMWAFIDSLRNPTLSNRVVGLLDSYWLARQVAYNTVVVDKGGVSETFQRLPNGNFNSVTGSSKLVQNTEPSFNGYLAAVDFWGVSLTYTGKDGDIINFVPGRMSMKPWCCNWNYSITDPSFVATNWNFPDGTVVWFSYTTTYLAVNWGGQPHCWGGGLEWQCDDSGVAKYQPWGAVLAQVSNNRGRSLTFTLETTTVPVVAATQGTMQQEVSSVRISKVTDDTGRQVNFTLSDCNNVRLLCGSVGVSAPNGSWTYTYGSNGRMNAIFKSTDASSSPSYSLSYDSLFRVTSLTDKLGHTTYYYPGSVAKNEAWKRSDIVDSIGYTSTSIFDQWDDLLSSTDPLGRTTTYAYDNARRKIKEVAPEGNYSVFTYDVRSNLLSTTLYPKSGSALSPITNSSIYGEDTGVIVCSNPLTCNKPLKETNGRGYVTSYAWNSSSGLLTQIKSGLNGSLACILSGGTCPQIDLAYTTLDGMQFLASVTKNISTSQSTTTAYTYNTSNHYVLSSATVDSGTGKLNLTTSLAFDAIGNLTHVDGPRTDVSDISDYVWYSNRRLMMSIQPAATDNGTSHPRIATRYMYDFDGHVTQTDQGTATTSNGSDFTSLLAIAATYDGAGNKILQTTPTSVSQYTYDADDRLFCTAVRMNPAAFTSLPADACTLGTQGSFGPDRITRNTYDAAGQLLQIERALGTSVQQTYARYSYTLNGKQLAVADANASSLGAVSCSNGVHQGTAPAHQTDYCYDGLDRLASTAYPDGTTDQVTSYDADNNALTRVNRSGQTITQAYDPLDRIAGKAIPATTAVSGNTVTWGYDLTNNVTSLTDTLGNTLANVYDGAGRQISATNTVPGLSAKTIGYQVDAAGNRTRIIWPDGYYVTYGFDAASRMTAANENGSTALATFDYDSLGHPAWKQDDGASPGARASYSWSPEGDLYTLTQNLTGTAYDVDFTTQANQYSPAHQIQAAAISNAIYQYVPPVAETQTYATNGLNQYTSVTPSGGTASAVRADANGNLICSGVSCPSPGTPPATGGWMASPPLQNATWEYLYDPENRLMAASAVGTSATYAYDPQGRRTKKTVNGTVTYFLDSGDDEIAEYDGSGNLLRRYVPGPGVDQPIAMVTASGTQTFFHQDKVGNVIAMTDTSGNVAEGPYTYDAYGNCYASGNPCSTGVPYRYTGRRLDPETGLTYYRARYYAAAIGRFLQTDPVGYKDDINWYAYVGNDPTDKVDPSGNDEVVLYTNTFQVLGEDVTHESHIVGSGNSWTYQSKNGNAGFTSGSGPSRSQSHNENSGGNSKWSSQTFTSKAAALQYAVDHGGITSAFEHSATASQDKANVERTDTAIKGWYQGVLGNCGEAIHDGEGAAGIPHNSGINPLDDKKYMGSKQGQADGWKPVDLPKPTPPPPKKDQP